MQPFVSLSGSKRGILAFANVLLFLSLVGCDATVDPIEENDYHYSIFGTLNASTDTQFVRVEALRDSLPVGAPVDLDANVRLTDVTEGQTVTLRDSLFRYRGSTYAHNFYTTYPIRPAHTYRLTVRSSEGAESSAQVRVPDTFPTPTVALTIDPEEMRCSRYGGMMIIRIRDVERLIAVNALYYLQREGNTRRHSFGHLADTMQVRDDLIQARIGYGSDLCSMSQDVDKDEIEKIEIMVAASNPDWPDFMGMDWETVTLPGGASNVEGGMGLLGGIVTDTIEVYPL